MNYLQWNTLSLNSIAGRFIIWLSLTVEGELADFLHRYPRGLYPFREKLQQKQEQVTQVKLGPTYGNVGLDQERLG